MCALKKKGGEPHIRWALNSFILDSRRVLAPSTRGAGIRYQNTSRIQMLLASHLKKAERVTIFMEHLKKAERVIIFMEHCI